MSKTTLAKLEAARAIRPPGYVDAILAAGVLDPDGEHHHIPAAQLAAIRARFGIVCAPPATAAQTSPDAPTTSEATMPPEPPLPGMLTQLRNAAAAAARTVRAVAAGQPLTVSEDIAAQRLALCRACEHFRPSDQRCAQCGCRMANAVIRKIALATEKCPIGKWSAE